jgi:hypothetical protein
MIVAIKKKETLMLEEGSFEGKHRERREKEKRRKKLNR